MDVTQLPEYNQPKKRACAVVYRISDRQVGWLYWDDIFVPITWEKAKGDAAFTSAPEFKEL